MLKYASRIPATNEIAALVWGQSNGRPWGTKAEGYAAAPHLQLAANGVDVAITSGFVGTVGSGRVVTLSSGTLDADDWIGAELRLGTPTTPKAGRGLVTANGTGNVTVTWTHAADTAATAGYLCFPDDRRKSYPTVRVLTPYQPETPGAYPAGAPAAPAAGYTVPSSITSFSDWGLFLPLTFLEGVDAYGISDSSDASAAPTTHAATAATPTTFSFANAVPAVDIFVDGYIVVKHDGGVSWATITTNNTTTQFTVASWGGAGTPTGTPGTWTYEAWIPHYNNSPHAKLIGFRYPNNEMQPGGLPLSGLPTGIIHNRPRGRTAYCYADRFGMLVELGWRLSTILGKRVNLIYLAVNSCGLFPQKENLEFAFQGQLGWWDDDFSYTWSPAVSNGLAGRYKRMIQVMAPAALLAESNSAPLRAIGVVGMQGEAEAYLAAGREIYHRSLPMFYRWLRETVAATVSGGGGLMALYASIDKLPIAHAPILSHWEQISVQILPGFSVSLPGDSEKLVNKAITDFVAKDQFATSWTVTWETGGAILGHYNGTGEVKNGAAAAEALLALVDAALSSEDDPSDPIVLQICNEALSFVGETAKVTSLTASVDASVQAALCRRFYPVARATLLQRCAWSFATRRQPLAAVSYARTDEWPYAYGLPTNAIRVFSVLPAGAGDDVVLAPMVVPLARSSQGAYRRSYGAGYAPQDFVVEQGDDGYAVVRAKVADAVARFNVEIGDASQYSPLFKTAVAWQLAAFLAGPIIKGPEGMQMSQQALGMVERTIAEAKVQDGVQRSVEPQPQTPWLAARRSIR